MDSDYVFDNLQQLAESVDNNGGVQTFATWQLRDSYGADRLGRQVRSNISRDLRGLGLGHFPVEIPDRGNHEVRLYRVSSPVGEVIEAVLQLGEHGDQKLVDVAGTGAAQVLDKIRELVCP